MNYHTYCKAMNPSNSIEISQSHKEDEEKKALIKSMISSLPYDNGWLSSDDICLRQYQGFWYHTRPLKQILPLFDNIQTRLNISPSDIILCTSRKSGTTWLKALAFSIATRNRYKKLENNPLLTTHTNPHHLIPSLEFIGPRARDLQLPLLCTHLPYTHLPKSVLDCDCKMVHIWRDPKDAFVSCWHFARKIRANKDSSEPISLDSAFDLFCRGVSPFGPYWDNVLSYWKVCQEHPEKVLFLKYEDMMCDPVSNVRSLAKFMGCAFSNEEENEGLPSKIVEMCSFENLSNLEGNKSGSSPSLYGADIMPHDSFFRKGKIGDWKNYLTPEMAERIDQITAEKFGHCGLQL